jgi:hypothetical protein
MKQYNAIKEKYPEAIVLFRIGDFYETFNKDAEIVSKILDIPLAKNSEGVSLSGFVFHSFDENLRKLVNAGHRVATAEQLEDPKLAKKEVKRGVVSLVEPKAEVPKKEYTLDDINQMEKDDIVKKKCLDAGGMWVDAIAEKGLALSFTAGGTWEVLKVARGATHKEGGIPITVTDEGNVTFRNNDSDIHAKNGLVIKAKRNKFTIRKLLKPKE